MRHRKQRKNSDKSNYVLERLEKVIKTLAQEQAETRKEQIEIRREQAEIRKELQKAMARVDEAMARVDKAMTRVDEVMARFDEGMAMVKEAMARFDEGIAMVKEAMARFDEGMATVKEAMARVDSSVIRVDGAVEAIQIASGGLQRRAGRKLEDTLAGVFRYALRTRDIKPESIKLRQKIPIGEKIIEVDLLMHDNKTYMFEVSFYVDDDKAEKVGERIQAVCKHLGLKREDTQIILISLDRTPEAIEVANKYGIILIP
jgi:exonuclease VII small subunit